MTGSNITGLTAGLLVIAAICVGAILRGHERTRELTVIALAALAGVVTVVLIAMLT